MTTESSDTMEGLRPASMLAQLVETIGWAATVQLCGRFGGEDIYVPVSDSIFVAQRNASIVRDWQAGRPCSEIARTHNVTTTYARAIVRRLADQAPQTRQGSA